MKTKEEVLEKHYKHYRDRIAYYENVLDAMAEYAFDSVIDELESIKQYADDTDISLLNERIDYWDKIKIKINKK